MSANPKGLLHHVRVTQDRVKRAQSTPRFNDPDAVGIVEIGGSGDYLAFLDEGDPVFLPRGILDWQRDRTDKTESFLKKLVKRLM